MAELEIEDQRVLFVANYVLQITNQKPEKFTKVYLLEDTTKVYNDFFEEPKKRTLFVFLGPSGSFVSQLNWPGVHKSKGCYFVKRKAGKIANDAVLSKLLVYGDMSTTPVEQFAILVDEVRYLFGQLHTNTHTRTHARTHAR